MASLRKFALIILATFPMLVGGCAASVDSVTPEKETPPPSEVVVHNNNPVESAILSMISTLGPGVERTAGDVSFIAGEDFASASGLRCRSVTITQSSPAGTTRGRIVCENNQSWFFSKDIFLMEIEGD